MHTYKSLHLSEPDATEPANADDVDSNDGEEATTKRPNHSAKDMTISLGDLTVKNDSAGEEVRSYLFSVLPFFFRSHYRFLSLASRPLGAIKRGFKFHEWRGYRFIHFATEALVLTSSKKDTTVFGPSDESIAAGCVHVICRVDSVTKKNPRPYPSRQFAWTLQDVFAFNPPITMPHPVGLALVHEHSSRTSVTAGRKEVVRLIVQRLMFFFVGDPTTGYYFILFVLFHFLICMFLFCFYHRVTIIRRT